METNVYKYIPTASEKKLLEVLINPENFGKSITEICKIAKVSRKVYYTATSKPEFIDYINDITKGILKDKTYDILMAACKYAIECPNNHQDRKMLLELAGEYRGSRELKHMYKVEQPIEVVFISKQIDEKVI